MFYVTTILYITSEDPGYICTRGPDYHLWVCTVQTGDFLADTNSMALSAHTQSCYVHVLHFAVALT